MKLSISNIAWPFEKTATLLPLFRERNIRGIEVAPTKLWPNWENASPRNATEYKNYLLAEGFDIPALQAILYGKPDCLLFGEKKSRDAFFQHCCFVADLANHFGANTVVYGAPQSREMLGFAKEKCDEIALDMFSKIAQYHAQQNIYFCIEANPEIYGCEYLQSLSEIHYLVTTINSPGLKIHMDAATLYYAKEINDTLFDLIKDELAHFHISEPNLGQFIKPIVPHPEIAKRLKTIHYQHYYSLEMREHPDYLKAIRIALDYIENTYVI